MLPLENLSGDPAQEYFTDGMTEELISELAKIGALRVISRTSVMRYKRTKQPLPQVARELQVDGLVEGSVVRSGDRVRVTANLIQANPEKHLWADSYARDLRDVLALQSDVATAIAREIQVKLTPADQQRLASPRQVDPEAYEAYLRGLYSWHLFTLDGFRSAVDYYNQAIEKDPGYARAYSGLADSYAQLAGRLLPPNEAMPKAKAAALKALALDDRLAESHLSLGYVKFYYEYDWAGAEEEFKRALQLNPGYPGMHSVYAFYLATRNRFDEALAEIRRASELEPSPGFWSCGEARILYYARRYDQAIELHRKTRERYPRAGMPCASLGMAYMQENRFEEAIRQYEVTIARSGEETLPTAALGYAYARAGNRAEANKVLNQLLSLRQKRFVSAYDMAVLYVGLGDKEQVFVLLNKAVEEHAGLLVYLKVDPVFDPLRSDPRFQDLLRRIGLPP